jgi:hypothetical protein
MMASMNLTVRIWSATATPAGADRYRRYFAGTLLPELRERPGFAGAYLVGDQAVDDPAADGTVALTAWTFWESPEAIRAFAGDDISASVVEPRARAVLLDFDRTVTHRNVLVSSLPSGPRCRAGRSPPAPGRRP